MFIVTINFSVYNNLIKYKNLQKKNDNLKEIKCLGKNTLQREHKNLEDIIYNHH